MDAAWEWMWLAGVAATCGLPLSAVWFWFERRAS